MNFPDLPMRMSGCYARTSFRVDYREFKRTKPGEYTDGKIVCYCNQQDPTSWRASIGDFCTGSFWAPEFAVATLLEIARQVQSALLQA